MGYAAEIHHLFVPQDGASECSPKLARSSYLEFRKYLRRIAGRDIPDHELDDLAHDALLVGLERIDVSFGERAVRRYERTTIIRLLYRLRARWTSAASDLDESFVRSPPSPVDGDEVLDLVRIVQSILSDEELEVIRRRLAGQSFAEIADDMKLLTTTARSRHHRAIAKIAAHLDAREHPTENNRLEDVP
jgi:DNA-directed RNA polymerase specialized sigma24 family protein